jgi:hypothetical protein
MVKTMSPSYPPEPIYANRMPQGSIIYVSLKKGSIIHASDQTEDS